MFVDMINPNSCSSSSKQVGQDQPATSEPTTKSQRTKIIMVKSEDNDRRVPVLCLIRIWTLTHYLHCQNSVTEKLKLFYENLLESQCA